MKIENKLTLKHLKQNRSRTFITVLGIAVSTMLITSIIVSLFSFMNTFSVWATKTNGDYHFSVQGSMEDLQKVLVDNDNVDTIGYRLCISDKECGYKIHGVENNASAIGTMYAGDTQYFKDMVQCDYEGRFPTNSNEIMIEKSIIEDNNLDWEIGDYVTISTGERLSSNAINSYFHFAIKGEYKNGEIFNEKDCKEYKIVGILDKNLVTYDDGVKVLRGVDEGESKTYNAYVKLKKITPFSYVTINSILDSFNFSEEDRMFYTATNDLLLSSHFAFELNDTMVYTIGATILLLVLIVILTAVFLIKNSFSMSFAEKVKYLGMLSSVGATKKQIRNSILFESTALGLVGISSGFVLGSGLIVLLLKITSTYLLKNELLEPAGIDKIYISIPFLAVIIIFLLSMIAVILSAISPAKKALEITPIDAIRQSEEVNIHKKIRTPKTIRKIFGFEGELAYKNLKRNGRKARIINVSIIISVVLFICVNYFCSVYTQYSNIDYVSPYQVEAQYYIDENYSQKTQSEFEKYMDTIPEIEKYYSTNSHLFEYYKEVDQTISDIYYDFSNVPNSVLTNKYKSLFDDDLIFFINYVDDDDFNALCEANNINPKDYYYDYNNKLKAVVMNNISHKENSSPVFTDELKGITLPTKYTDAMLDDLEISTEEMAKEYFGESSFEFGDFVEYDEDNYLCNLNSPNCVSLYIPVSVYLSFQYDGDSRPYSYGIVTTEHKKVTDEINKYFQNTTDDDSYYALDIEYYRLQSLAILTLVKVLMYFFITFITIITASNIVNTISSSIHLRKKEFAMLQSVGVTPKGFKKMIALESVFYGIRGLIVGLPLSLLICFVMNKVTQFNTIPFDINIFMYLIVLVAVFVLVGATMLISVNKVKNDSIIDSLKTDIY